jgi:hypothetical protein
MNIYYNNQPFETYLVFKQGITIDMSFNVYRWNPVTEVWDLWDLTGSQIDGQFRRIDGVLIKDFSSAGITPAFTIAGSSINLYENIGFLNPEFLEFDFKVTTAGDTFILTEGLAKVKKQITI